jgi:hypothetical protein
MARFTKKTKIAIVTAALVIGASGTAFAYWTQAGSGTGTGSMAAPLDVVVHQTGTVTGLFPGGPAQPLSGTFDNPNSGPVTVGAVSATVTATTVGGCDPLWYVITGTGSPATQVLASANGTGAWSGLSVALTNNLTVNQDLCKTASITITYTVAAGV